jgi:hypothetical protein
LRHFPGSDEPQQAGRKPTAAIFGEIPIHSPAILCGSLPFTWCSDPTPELATTSLATMEQWLFCKQRGLCQLDIMIHHLHDSCN